MKILILIMILLSIKSHATVPADREKFTCGVYELKGMFLKDRISSTEFPFQIYPGSKRSFNVILTGYYGSKHTMFQKRPVIAKVKFATSKDAKNDRAQIMTIQGTTRFNADNVESMVKLIKKTECE